MSLTSKIIVDLAATLSKALDHVSPRSELLYRKHIDLADGIGADQADKVFSDKRQLAGGASEDLDLAGGGLVDALGDALTLARVKVIAVYAYPTNPNPIQVGGAAANAFATPFGDATDKVNVRPGGLFLLVAKDATGYPVTGGTGDLLRITAGAGGNHDYDVLIIGASA